MRAIRFLLIAVLSAAICDPAVAGSARVKKVLPHLMDREGRHMLSPSLYERDAYQAQLRLNPAQCRGLRFDVHWKARGYSQLKLLIEARGTVANVPTRARLEQTVRPRRFFTQWSVLRLEGKGFQDFGDLVAWRATLLDGETEIAEHKSFLW